MELRSVFDPMKFVPSERRVVNRPESDAGAPLSGEAAEDLLRRTAHMGGSTHFADVQAEPDVDEGHVLALIEMQYQEFTARRALEELFESGQLTALGD
jgi:hypothetical protein